MVSVKLRRFYRSDCQTHRVSREQGDNSERADWQSAFCSPEKENSFHIHILQNVGLFYVSKNCLCTLICFFLH